MMPRIFRQTAYMLVILLAGCSTSPPVHFYTLTGNAVAPEQHQEAASTQRVKAPILIEVLPVSVPQRLARPQIVVGTDSARVDILEQDRWSSPFNVELHDAFSAGIVQRLNAVDVTRGGRLPSQVAYRIALVLPQFEAIRGEQVKTVFNWSITRSDDTRGAACSRNISVPLSSTSTDVMVQGIQHAVNEVVEAISVNIQELDAAAAVTCR